MNKLIRDKISTALVTTLLSVCLLAPAVITISIMAPAQPVSAICPPDNPGCIDGNNGGGSGTGSNSSQGPSSNDMPAQKCASNEVSMDHGKTCCPKSAGKNATSCLYAKYINPLVNLLSAAVGVVVVAAIIMGAIQYSSSAGDPQKATNGKKHIQNALLGLVAYLLLYAFLQFIVVGGIK